MKPLKPPTHILRTFYLLLGYFLPPFLTILLSSCYVRITTLPQSKSEDEIVAEAKRIHERVLTMDTHDDISGNFASDNDDVASPDNRRQVSLPKMKRGGLDAEFFAVFTSVGDRSATSYETAYKNANILFAAIHRLPQRYPDLIDIAYTPDDVVRIHASGKLVACIGMENGYPIGNDITRVKEFHEKGTRYITLTHSGHNQIL